MDSDHVKQLLQLSKRFLDLNYFSVDIAHVTDSHLFMELEMIHALILDVAVTAPPNELYDLYDCAIELKKEFL